MRTATGISYANPDSRALMAELAAILNGGTTLAKNIETTKKDNKPRIARHLSAMKNEGWVKDQMVHRRGDTRGRHWYLTEKGRDRFFGGGDD